jgi:hypothetical protein
MIAKVNNKEQTKVLFSRAPGGMRVSDPSMWRPVRCRDLSGERLCEIERPDTKAPRPVTVMRTHAPHGVSKFSQVTHQHLIQRDIWRIGITRRQAPLLAFLAKPSQQLSSELRCITICCTTVQSVMHASKSINTHHCIDSLTCTLPRCGTPPQKSRSSIWPSR